MDVIYNLLKRVLWYHAVINYFHVIYPSGRTKRVQFFSRKN